MTGPMVTSTLSQQFYVSELMQCNSDWMQCLIQCFVIGCRNNFTGSRGINSSAHPSLSLSRLHPRFGQADGRHWEAMQYQYRYSNTKKMANIATQKPKYQEDGNIATQMSKYQEDANIATQMSKYQEDGNMAGSGRLKFSEEIWTNSHLKCQMTGQTQERVCS